MTPTPGKAKVYTLLTPSGSPLHLGPTSFRPTIALEGQHVVFAVSAEAARNAMTAVHKADWKPSEELAKVCESVPDNLVLLGVNDVTDTLPPLLASLPGTLQTMINTSVALAKAKGGAVAGDAAATPPPGTTSRGSGGPMAGGPGANRRGGMAAPGAGASKAPNSGRGGGPPNVTIAGGGGNPNPSGSAASGDAAIVFNIDAEKLPKASDLKSYLFPSTFAISVTDQDIRIISRQAFPELASLVNAVPMLGMMPGANAMVDMSKLAEGGQASPGGPGAAGPGAGVGGVPPGGPTTSKAAMPGGRRGGGAAPRPR